MPRSSGRSRAAAGTPGVGVRRALEWNHRAIKCVAFDSELQKLAGGGLDGTVKLWDIVDTLVGEEQRVGISLAQAGRLRVVCRSGTESSQTPRWSKPDSNSRSHPDASSVNAQGTITEPVSGSSETRSGRERDSNPRSRLRNRVLSPLRPSASLRQNNR